FLTFASGGAFTQFSHEFQTLSDAGEDTVYLHRAKKIAINKEVLTDEVLTQLGVARGELEEVKAIEVGNIFDFGGVKSKQLGLFYKNDVGEEVPVHLGSYGIGITRLMGTVVEALSDEKGLVWPESIAPFALHLVSLGKDGDEVSRAADALYDDLVKAGKDVLYDDRDFRAGEKFAESDLIGIPKRIVVGKDAAANGIFEVVDRATGAVSRESREKLLAK
ncbi:prolyl-tRNA synthetase, partial [Patescibacteria group bacterium]|nr:prolyl-tRNA synthetase [Patescibacteria group bacterium]